MESIGKYLKAERESRNLSLREVSESTKIKELLLRALEEDRYDLISSPVYVKGFLDAYARCLGLDTNNIILQYQGNYDKRTPSKGPGLKQRKTSPSSKRWITFSKRRVTHWHLIIAIFVMILLIAMVIYRISLKSSHGWVSSFIKGGGICAYSFTSCAISSACPEVVNDQRTNPPEWVEDTAVR